MQSRLLFPLTAVFLVVLGIGLAAQDQKKDFKDVDLEAYGVKLVPAKKDAKTGFLVAGKNATADLRRLAALNGRSIADLEKDMRPGASSEVGSTKGFLGQDEKLLDILVEDNQYVVDELGLTHQELARHLHALAAFGAKHPELLYHGKRFKVKIVAYRGTQLSPFYDGTKTNQEAIVQNLDNGKEINYSLLVPHIIERYGFYEGKGTPYRVDPRKVVEVFDFLKKKEKP